MAGNFNPLTGKLDVAPTGSQIDANGVVTKSSTIIPSAPVVPAGSTILTSANQIKDFNIQGQVGKTGTAGSYLYGTPKVSVPVASTLNAKDLPTIPDPNVHPAVPVNPPEQLNPITKTIAQNTKDITAIQQAADTASGAGTALTNVGQTATDLATARTGLETKGQFAQTQYDKFQVENKYQKLTDDTNKMNVMDAELTAEIQNFKDTPQGGTLQLYNSRLGRMMNEKASRLSIAQATVAADQGNIKTAQELMQTAVDLQFVDQQQKVTNLTNDLKDNWDLFNATDKKRAEVMQYDLTQEQTKIDVAKADRLTSLTYQQTAASNNAPATVLKAMEAAKTTNEALIACGEYCSTKTYDWLDTGRIDPTNGEKIYAFVDKKAGTVKNADGTTYNSSTPTSGATGNGIVDGYDITTYATDPQHEAKIAAIRKAMGQFTSLDQVQAYINKSAPKSPITAEMISNTSAKYGVPWEILVAMMVQDSSLGTAGKAVSTMNPGNVGNTDSGATQKFSSWQAGVDAVGQWLSNHKVTPEQIKANEIKSTYIPMINGAVNVAPANSQPAIRRELYTYLNSGDTKLLNTKLVQYAMNYAPVAVQQQEQGREEMMLAQIRLVPLMNEYTRLNGDTNFFKGTLQQMEEAVGYTGNDKMSIIKAQIALAFQDYRRGMTGAQFSAAESAEYGRVFNSISNTVDLNATRSRSLALSLIDNTNAFYTRQLGMADAGQILIGDTYYKPLSALQYDGASTSSTNQPYMVKSAKGGVIDLNQFVKPQ